MIIDSPVVSGSLTSSGPFTEVGNVTISGSLTVTGSINMSGSIASASQATSASYANSASYSLSSSYASLATTASYATVATSASYADAFTVKGTLTAQTLVVQTITSSVEYSSGSNVFGSSTANTQTFTGSVNITGSLNTTGPTTVTGSLYTYGNVTHDGVISGSQPANNPSSSLILISGSIIPASGSTAGASAMYMNTVMSASANNQTLVGLDINPTFTNGAFTGVNNFGLRVSGIIRGLSDVQSWNGNSSLSANNLTFNNLSLTARIVASSNTTNLAFKIGTNDYGQFFATTGNFTLQNGGTFTDNGYRLQVNGSGSASGSLYVSGSSVMSGSLNVTAGITGSVSGTASYASNANTASYALTASYAANVPVTASYANQANSSSYAATASYANAFTVGGTITAQTLVVQTITSSVEYSSGSNVFGNSVSNTHQFTGSVLVSGSIGITGSISTFGTAVFSTSVLSQDYRYTNTGYITYDVANTGVESLIIRKYGTAVLTFNSASAIFGNSIGIVSSPNAKLDLGGTVNGNYKNAFLFYNDNNAGPFYGTKNGFYMDQFSLSNNVTLASSTAAGAPGSFIIAGKNTAVNDASSLSPIFIINTQTGATALSGSLSVNGGNNLPTFTIKGNPAFDGESRLYLTNNAYIYGRTNLILTGRLDGGNDSFSFGTNNRLGIVFNANEGGAQGATGTEYYGIQLELNSKTLAFQSSGSNAAGRPATLALTQAGNVGINTNNPQAKLDQLGSRIFTNSTFYGRQETQIFQSAFTNPTTTILNAVITGAYSSIVIKVRVFQNTVAGAFGGNIHTGYALYTLGSTGTYNSSVVSTMAIEASFAGVNNVGTLSWSGTALQYTPSRASNYDGYVVIVEWGANTNNTTSPTYNTGIFA